MSAGSDKDALRQKYDECASYYSAWYADPDVIARRQVAMVSRWGTVLPPGARVLEVGCADGFVTEALARAGFAVTAVDLSPGMVETARRRVAAAGLVADVQVADIDELDLGRFDAVLAVMGTFFRYATDPTSALATLGAHTGKKLLVDLDPRGFELSAGSRALSDEGFCHVAWRPYFVSVSHRMPPMADRVLELAEQIPLVRSLPLRWRFKVVLKGERA